MPEQIARQEVSPPPTGDPPSTPKTLPPHVAAALWRGGELGGGVASAVATGFSALDRELPGGGWPCQNLTELLCEQASVLEWRLFGPALRHLVERGQSIVAVGPPKAPHVPGLRDIGLNERQLVWIRADSPSERLWSTEQLVKANACGALIAWLPQARPAQIRRLQVAAQRFEGLVLVCRPASARFEASAAPLRVAAAAGMDWELRVRILKRRGAAQDELLMVPSIPGGLASIMTPRLRRPSAWAPSREVAADVVGSIATSDRAKPLSAPV